MALFECQNCRRVYSEISVVNLQSKPFDGSAVEWTNAVARQDNYAFLHGPGKPPYGFDKTPCHPSGRRSCTLADLAIYKGPPPKETILVTALPSVTVMTTPAHIKPVWSIPDSPSTPVNPLTYASGRCHVCQGTGVHSITESTVSRWVAGTIHQYLSDVLHVPASSGFMIGVAVRPSKSHIYVAYSSNSGENAQAHLSGCKFQGWKLTLYGNFGFADISKSLGGTDITRHKSLSMVKVGDSGERSSATCAASKLAKSYFEGSLKGWNMTEIAYGSMEGYTDGAAAGSCMGCEAFLPTLLCDQ